MGDISPKPKKPATGMPGGIEAFQASLEGVRREEDLEGGRKCEPEDAHSAVEGVGAAVAGEEEGAEGSVEGRAHALGQGTHFLQEE